MKPLCATCQRWHEPEASCLEGVVLVCGGRDFGDHELLVRTLEVVRRRVVMRAVREGEAQGADLMARRWAEERRIPVQPYAAEWRPGGVFNPRAGPDRNRLMLDDQDVTDPMKRVVCCVAFMPGPKGGTKHMARLAEAAGLPVWRVGWSDERKRRRKG